MIFGIVEQASSAAFWQSFIFVFLSRLLQPLCCSFLILVEKTRTQIFGFLAGRVGNLGSLVSLRSSVDLNPEL